MCTFHVKNNSKSAEVHADIAAVLLKQQADRMPRDSLVFTNDGEFLEI